MELLVVVALVIAAALSFLRSNTQRGAELVRAYVFLGGVAEGHPKEVVAQWADQDMSDRPTEFIRAAIEHMREKYGGSQIAMIRAAYKAGMSSKLPAWYRAMVVDPDHSAQRGNTYSQVPLARTPAPMQTASYDKYEALVVREVRRLDNAIEGELHWIELVDHEGTRNAFKDGVDPLRLALRLRDAGPPSAFTTA